MTNTWLYYGRPQPVHALYGINNHLSCRAIRVQLSSGYSGRDWSSPAYAYHSRAVLLEVSFDDWLKILGSGVLASRFLNGGREDVRFKLRGGYFKNEEAPGAGLGIDYTGKGF